MKAITGFISVLILGIIVGAFGDLTYASGMDNRDSKFFPMDEISAIGPHNENNLFHSSGYGFPKSDPESDSLILFAGNDTTVCQSGFYIDVSGVSQNFYYTSWATTGDGFFAQATKLNTQYFPGQQDRADGMANLYLVGICVQPEYLRIVDSVNIYLVHTPDCFAGIDASVCDGNLFQTEAEASWFSELFWSTSGDGTFDQNNILLPKYQHGTQDLANGEVTLQLTAFPEEPCQFPQTNQMTLHIKQSPTLTAGNDTIICEDRQLQLYAEISHSSEILWMTSGDGTFSDLTSPNPVYTPGNNDISNGGTTLSVIVTPEFPCETFATDQLELEIVSHPTVSVGGDQTICETDVVQCFSLVENYESLQWFALGGDGTFEDPNAMNTLYYPGEHEKSTGVFYIMLLVNASNPCNSELNASFKVDLVNQAIISGGPDQHICSTDTAMLFGMGEQYDDVFWETAGDGTFLGGEYLSRKYMAGPGDIENGSVNIFLCASSATPCENPVCDTILLHIEKMATVNAGIDDTICEQTVLSGLAENYAQLYWTTSGDGTFDDPTLKSASYFAGASDLDNLSVTLTLLAEPIAPCLGFAEDDLELTIDMPVLLASEMEDQEIFSGDPASMGIEVVSLQEVSYQWYHDGEIIEGANDPELILDDCQPVDAGRYRCVFSNNCFSLSTDTALISVFNPHTQIVDISSGWNAVSSYVMPATSAIEIVLSPILSELVILYSDNGIFYPGQDLQTFTNWNANTGYIIKTTSSGSLSVNGFVKYPLDEIILQPGWSVLPAGQFCPLNAGILFADYPEIKAIKEIGGFRVYWPEHDIFTLENINPGKAYKVFNGSENAVSFTFPGCEE